MLFPLSSTELALRDTLITKASGGALDDLSRLYGIPRLRIIEDTFWRRALRAAVFGPRGTLGTTHAVLEALFDQWAERCFSYQVTIDPEYPTRITRVQGPPGFFPVHAARLVRVTSPSLGSRVYYAASASDTYLVLSNQPGPYWSAFDASALTVPEDGIAKIIPFTYAEPDPVTPCALVVYIDGDLWYTPPSYMQPDAGERPEDQPYGGAIVNVHDGDPTTPTRGDQVNGPFPLYLPGDEVGGALRATLDALLAAGVRVVFKLVQFDETDTAFSVLRYNAANGYPPLYDWRNTFTIPLT